MSEKDDIRSENIEIQYRKNCAENVGRKCRENIITTKIITPKISGNNILKISKYRRQKNYREKVEISKT